MTTSRHYDVLGLLLSFRVLPEEVDGKFALMEAVVPPGWARRPIPMPAKPRPSGFWTASSCS